MSWLRSLLLLLTLALSSTGWALTSGDYISLQQLPPEARQVLEQIKSGGPFAYPRKDGSTFNNFEKRLPAKPRGYYREYTVPTPGKSNRGARRIVTGGRPAEVYYYTDDHYRSFRRLQE